MRRLHQKSTVWAESGLSLHHRDGDRDFRKPDVRAALQLVHPGIRVSALARKLAQSASFTSRCGSSNANHVLALQFRSSASDKGKLRRGIGKLRIPDLSGSNRHQQQRLPHRARYRGRYSCVQNRIRNTSNPRPPIYASCRGYSGQACPTSHR